MRTKSLFMTLLLVIFHTASNAEAQETSQKTISEISSGEHYWLAEKLDFLSNVTEGETELIGDIWVSVGYRRFRIKKELVQDRQAKTKGIKMALDAYVSRLKTESKQFAESTTRTEAVIERFQRHIKNSRDKLNSMTGLDFDNPDEWKAWFKENQDYLVWSDKKDQFTIDEQAKKAGVPTEEYRKSHPWSEYP